MWCEVWPNVTQPDPALSLSIPPTGARTPETTCHVPDRLYNEECWHTVYQTLCLQYYIHILLRLWKGGSSCLSVCVCVCVCVCPIFYFLLFWGHKLLNCVYYLCNMYKWCFLRLVCCVCVCVCVHLLYLRTQKKNNNIKTPLTLSRERERERERETLTA